MNSTFISRGAYGDVWSYPQDKRAVKLLEIKNKDISTLQSAARELFVLVRNGPYMVSFLKAEFKYGSIELHLSLMETDLLKEIKRRQLPLEDIRTYTEDVARGLHWMHTNNICHRDLKPSNILIRKNHAYLCDFGLSRPFCDTSRANNLTDYMVTRWYRAPEVLDAKEHGYTRKIDTWAFGCIVYEMCVGRAMFPIGDSKELKKALKRREEKLERIKDEKLRLIATGALETDVKKRWTATQCLGALTSDSLPTYSAAYYTGSRITDRRVKGWVTPLLSRYPGREHTIMHGLMLFEVSGKSSRHDFNCAMAVAYLIFEKLPCKCGMYRELTKSLDAKAVAQWMCNHYKGTHMLHEYEKTKDIDAVIANLKVHVDDSDDEDARSRKKQRTV